MLAHLQDMPHLMASLLSGAGLRLMECLCVRVKDLDFASHQITGRDGKGGQDRMTMLPQVVEDALQRHLAKVPLLHEEVCFSYTSASRLQARWWPIPHTAPRLTSSPFWRRYC